ncbi:hypothetical protein DFH07DRAFT_864875 [Mycena maculata]|uniref:D-lactate dehydrogenase (cytochrome) n=1 Tax=Mycena maculata TaxID=230809 RepID=A0AAD7KBT8_9AGAR|nr:hypothetical protein DFH07DRAFT_864875 [Mycena maculata]
MCGAVGGYNIALSTVVTPTTAVHPLEYGTEEDFKSAIKELKETLQHSEFGGISTDQADLIIHGESPYHHHNQDSGVVVYPRNTEDVVKIVKIANKFRMPVVPYSGATSLEGQISGHPGGSICVDMSAMDAILEIHEADADLVYQPGVGWMTVNETLCNKGIPLFFPIDPGPTGCSGTNAVQYGTAKGEWFLNLTVILPSGEVIKTRRRSRKSAAGFDLANLFIGAEVHYFCHFPLLFRLAPVPPTTVATVQFPNVRAAAEAVRQSIDVAGVGASVQRVELVDDNFMKALNKFGSSKRKYLEKDGLFFKFQGHSEAAMKEIAKIAKAVCEKNGGTGFKLANGQTEADAMWSNRKNALHIGLSILPGACVPVSKLPELVYETKKDIADAGMPSILVGHAGDRDFHTFLLQTLQQLKLVSRLLHKNVGLSLEFRSTKKHLVEEVNWGSRPGTVELTKNVIRGEI